MVTRVKAKTFERQAKTTALLLVVSLLFFSGCASVKSEVANILAPGQKEKQAGEAVCLNGSVQPVFSPGASKEFLSFIESANESIEVELFEFSYTPLMNELIKAKERGVRVRVILEPRLNAPNYNLKAMETLRKGGVEARWATLEFSRTHSKFAVVDGKKVVVGSHNWSFHAMEKNREAAAIIEDERVAGEFEEVFEEDWSRTQNN